MTSVGRWPENCLLPSTKAARQRSAQRVLACWKFWSNASAQHRRCRSRRPVRGDRGGIIERNARARGQANVPVRRRVLALNAELVGTRTSAYAIAA